jgi:hypothetical protein
MNSPSINSKRVKGIIFVVLLFACGLRIESQAQSTRQTQQPADKPWQELVSTEGRFSVLMPETPQEQFVPVPGQIVSTEVHVYLVTTNVATYAVIYSDLPDAAKDPELLNTLFDGGRDRLVGNGLFRMISEKDISTGKTLGREWVTEYGRAQVIKSRIFYRNERLYQIIFAGPQVDGMSAELVKFYDGLSAKFFSSFKIKS